MIMWALSSGLITCALSLILSSNPFTAAVTILTTALLVATMFSILMSSWLAFLIFLIYVGGMLVMFSYFVALTPNTSTISMNTLFPVLTFMILVTLPLITGIIHPSMPFTSFSVEAWFQNTNTPMLLALAIILLLTMIIVVKITHRSSGPLRAFMSYV